MGPVSKAVLRVSKSGERSKAIADIKAWAMKGKFKVGDKKAKAVVDAVVSIWDAGN